MWKINTHNLVLTLLILLILSPIRTDGQEKKVIFLTQIPCMFMESEKYIQDFTSKSIEDCIRINKETLNERKLTNLTLKAGTYTFRVKNMNVPYELGFWLRGKGVQRAVLPSISGGDIFKGETRDYTITLKPGKYYYSCPLNQTPDYTLIVN